MLGTQADLGRNQERSNDLEQECKHGQITMNK